MKSRWILLALCGLAYCAVAGAIEPVAGEWNDPQQRALYQHLIHEVRCLVCQNQTIADSNAALAADLRREIREMILAGQSEAEIKQFLVDRYGDFVLYRPPFRAATAILWLAPGLLVLFGGAVLWRTVRRRATLPIDDDDDPAPGP